MAKTQRRTDGLSKELIVKAATELLDTGGEAALTFRALTTRLSTGYGAIYHHVANKSNLLAAATDDVIARVMTGVFVDAEPGKPCAPSRWACSTRSGRRSTLAGAVAARAAGIYEAIGGLLDALDVPKRALFDAAGALVNYVLGVAGQNAANARALNFSEADRSAFLSSVAAQWTRMDPDKYPFVHKAATQLREHDDRDQFLAGVDIFLAGIATLR
jgi:AcrR family transcriptional regulator